MENEKDYWLAWSGCPQMGPVRFGHLVKVFQSAQGAWSANESELTKAGVRGKWLQDFLRYREKFDFNQLRHQLAKWGVKWFTKDDEEYPASLREIEKAPFVIYVMGKHAGAGFPSTSLRAGKPAPACLAVVGTRRVTSYGRQVTRQLVEGLVSAGLGIVSGLMYGVDEIAHRACLESGGYTMGVWAGGLDTLFNGSRKALAELILDPPSASGGGGTLISEFPLGMPPSAQTFPYRNRIVAALSCGVLVTEGSDGSGTLITAGYAAEQGKEVFAVPGPITSQQSVAPLQLIKEGAKLVTSVKDILEELKIQNSNFKIKQDAGGKYSHTQTSDDEQKIIDLLKSESLDIDELVRRLKISVSELGGTLSLMELKNWVKEEGGKWRLES